MRDDTGECECDKCCLPTILAERDEAMSERDEAVTARVRAHAALRRAEEHERETLRDLDNATAERDAAKAEAARAQDDNERLRISLAVAIGLLSVIRGHIVHTTAALPVEKFLTEMRAGETPSDKDLKRALRQGEP